MLAPISWLKDYVDINVSPEVLAKKLVAIGFEVEEIIYQEKSASKVVVGKIVEVEKPVIQYIEKPKIKKVFRTKYIRNPLEYIILGAVCFLFGLIIGCFLV